MFLFFLKVEIAKALHKRIKSDQATIAILTPYRAQKDQVLSLMGKNEIAAVVTINESQGEDLIIFMTHQTPHNYTQVMSMTMLY